jgi:hypothetical protein
MTKTRRPFLYFLLAVLAILLVIAYYYNREGPVASVAFSPEGQYQPIAVENPSLRFDLLDRVHKVEYSGRHRNIFGYTPLQPEIPAVRPGTGGLGSVDGAPPIPQGPPPVFVDLKFFGYVEDPRIGLRRAFFTNGEDVFIAGIGDTLEGRLRVVRIMNDTVELEEISSGRRTTVPIEQDPRIP